MRGCLFRILEIILFFGGLSALLWLLLWVHPLLCLAFVVWLSIKASVIVNKGFERERKENPNDC